MSTNRPGLLPMRTVAVSASESPDLKAFGLSQDHLADAMAEIASNLLASGLCLAYGRDLRPHGFTELLFDRLLRYRGHPRHSRTLSVTNHLAWPVHISMGHEALAKFAAGHEQAATLVLLDRGGARLSWKERLALPAHSPSKEEWDEGLTSMRQTMVQESDARILLGGKVENYKGKMPGVAEEALLAINARQPVYLMGGFGGCTRDIAETMGLVEPWAGSRPMWEGRGLFEDFGIDSLNNGLSAEENRRLAHIPYFELAVTMIRLGLYRLDMFRMSVPEVAATT